MKTTKSVPVLWVALHSMCGLADFSYNDIYCVHAPGYVEVTRSTDPKKPSVYRSGLFEPYTQVTAFGNLNPVAQNADGSVTFSSGYPLMTLTLNKNQQTGKYEGFFTGHVGHSQVANLPMHCDEYPSPVVGP